MTKSEDVLIKKFRAGNGVIFKEIFDRYYLPVKSYGFQYIEDDEIVEDFVQDAFLKVWEKRADFYVAAIKSFLYMSVRNACLDYLRHQKVQRRNEPELILWLTEEGEEEFILEEEVHAMVYDAIKDLSERSRRVVILTMEGLSNPEIAKELGVSVNTVKTQKRKAYAFLREELKHLFIIFLVLMNMWFLVDYHDFILSE